MKDVKKEIKFILIVLSFGALIAAFSAFLVVSMISAPKASADVGGNAFQLVPQGISEASTSVTTAGQQILATSTGRMYAIISNDSGVGVYLHFSNGYYAQGTTTYTGTSILNLPDGGIYLAASSTYSIEQGRNMYYGPIFAVTKIGTAIVTTVNGAGAYSTY